MSVGLVMPKMDLTRSRQEQLNELYARRAEFLITELLGELVKVRGLGYKTMRRATVEVRQNRRTENYEPWFKYEGDFRQQQVALIKRLDVMTPEGWATVWDDGHEDVLLFDGETLSTSAKPTNLKYKSGML